MKTAVVTGPTGPVGIALVKRLLEQGVNVVAVCHRGSRKVSLLPEHANLTVINCNLDEIRQLTGKMSQKNINGADVFYHLAWAQTTGAGRNDVECHLKNVQYCLDALETAVDIGCSRFVGTGSQAEYGLCDEVLTGQTPAFPISAYGMAKLSAGQLTRLRASQLGIEHVWTRILSVYGPHDGEKSMLSGLIRALRAGEVFETTEGKQIWDFIYEDDCANALYLIGALGISGKTYCIGSGVSRPLKEFILEAKELIDAEGTIKFGVVPYTSTTVMHLATDITELKNDTGFSPKVTFSEGIKKILCSLD